MFKKNLVAVLAVFALATPVLAGGGGFGGGGFGGGGFTRPNVTDNIRQQVGFDDDEWTVIQPKLQKVLDCQAALHLTTNRGGFGGGFGGTRGGATQPDPVLVAQQELNAVLQEQGSLVETITAKLKALREARVKAREALAGAQEDLRKVLTIRQEALLVNMGYLE